MDTLNYVTASVRENSRRFDVYRGQGSTYNGSTEKVDAVDAWVFDPTSTSISVVEGTDEDTSLTGLVVPSYDADGGLVERVHVNDELRLQSNTAKRYLVATKDGVPNELDPELWRLGLSHANSSQ